MKEETASCSTGVVPFTQQSINQVLHNSEIILDGFKGSAVKLGTLSTRITRVEERLSAIENPVTEMSDGLDALRKVLEKYMARSGNSSQSVS